MSHVPKYMEAFDDNLRLHYEYAGIRISSYPCPSSVHQQYGEHRLLFPNKELHSSQSSLGSPSPSPIEPSAARGPFHANFVPQQVYPTPRAEHPNPFVKERDAVVLGPAPALNSPGTTPSALSEYLLSLKSSPHHGVSNNSKDTPRHEAPGTTSTAQHSQSAPPKTPLNEKRPSTQLEWQLIALLHKAGVADKALRASFEDRKKEQNATIQGLHKDKKRLTSELASALTEVNRLSALNIKMTSAKAQHKKEASTQLRQQDSTLQRIYADLHQAIREREAAEVERDKAIKERDEMRRAKEKALADRSGAVTKKIELQAKLAVFERKGVAFNCPEFDALVKDRDEAKQSQAATASELERLREGSIADAATIRFLEESIVKLRAQLTETKTQLQASRNSKNTTQHNGDVKASSKAVQAPHDLGHEHRSMRTSVGDGNLTGPGSPLSPGRKRGLNQDRSETSHPIPAESEDGLPKKPRLDDS